MIRNDGIYANTFFTADTHFGHANAIKHANRPFKDVEEMNQQMIENWNTTVPKGGLVYVLGDFAWRKAYVYADQLNGQIILVRGSHDYHSDTKKTEKIVKEEHMINATIDGQRVTMCHYCMRVWHLSHYNSWHLYGHSHGRLDAVGKSLDVGVDSIAVQFGTGEPTDYRPINWYEIKAYMQHRPDNFNLVRRMRDEQPGPISQI